MCELAGFTRKRSQCSKQCESTGKKKDLHRGRGRSKGGEGWRGVGVRAVGYRSRGPDAGAGLGTGASSAYWSMEGEEVGRAFLHEKCEVRNGWGLVGVVGTHAYMHVW